MTKKGKLIILEAGDASGKATQTELLFRRLLSEGRDVTRVSFPDYESESSAPVKMYLQLIRNHVFRIRPSEADTDGEHELQVRRTDNQHIIWKGAKFWIRWDRWGLFWICGVRNEQRTCHGANEYWQH